MDYILNLLKNVAQTKIIHSLIVIIVSFVIYRFIVHFFMKSEKNSAINKRLNKKSKTYIRLIHSIIRYIFVILTLLIVLQINGINVSSMLAGVGIASAIIGLAVQDALKDIIRGFNILSDEYFSVGDVVEYKNITGKVTELGLRTTKIKDIATENVVSIANRNIEEIQVVAKSLFIKFPMPYEVPVDKAEKVISNITEKISEINDVEEVKYLGVSELADSSIQYLLKIVCSPDNRLQVRRDSYGCILRTLAKNNIAVPYNQIDVHQK